MHCYWSGLIAQIHAEEQRMAQVTFNRSTVMMFTAHGQVDIAKSLSKFITVYYQMYTEMKFLRFELSSQHYEEKYQILRAFMAFAQQKDNDLVCPEAIWGLGIDGRSFSLEASYDYSAVMEISEVLMQFSEFSIAHEKSERCDSSCQHLVISAMPNLGGLTELSSDLCGSGCVGPINDRIQQSVVSVTEFRQQAVEINNNLFPRNMGNAFIDACMSQG